MKTILCYGDSNTFGYDPSSGLRFPETVRWPGRLRHLLGTEYRLIEEGCNGRTTVFSEPLEPWKSGLYYLRPCLNSHKPLDLVILMLGSNDLKKSFHATAEQIAEGVGTLIEVIQTFLFEKQGYTPGVLLATPPEIGEDIVSSPLRNVFTETAVFRSRQFSRLYRQIAKKYGCIYFNTAEFVRASELDSLHLSPEGHEKLANALCQVVREILPED